MNSLIPFKTTITVLSNKYEKLYVSCPIEECPAVLGSDVSHKVGDDECSVLFSVKINENSKHYHCMERSQLKVGCCYSAVLQLYEFDYNGRHGYSVYAYVQKEVERKPRVNPEIQDLLSK